MFGVVEAKQRFEEILDRVVGGERVIVTRQGSPVAAIVPLDAAPGEPGEHGSERRPLGLGAFVGALAGWDDLDEVVASTLTSRTVVRGRPVPELE